jgi:hypothetical protein
MKKSYYIIVFFVVMQSCAAPSYRPDICTGEFEGPFTPYASGAGLSLAGRAKIVLPRYRVRGICRIECAHPDELLIDFRHSSLFGAYREDAAIVLEAGKLTIIDRERGKFYESDSAVAIIGSLLELTIYPDDLLYALLLAAPRCSEISRLETGDAGGRWFLRGEWRGRTIELQGSDPSKPDRFRICSLDGTSCYIISYKYDRTGTYPRRFDLVREGYGDERIVLEILEENIRPVRDPLGENRLNELPNIVHGVELSRVLGVSIR